MTFKVVSSKPLDFQERCEVVRRVSERLVWEWAEWERMIHEYMPVAQDLPAFL